MFCAATCVYMHACCMCGGDRVEGPRGLQKMCVRTVLTRKKYGTLSKPHVHPTHASQHHTLHICINCITYQYITHAHIIFPFMHKSHASTRHTRHPTSTCRKSCWSRADSLALSVWSSARIAATWLLPTSRRRSTSRRCPSLFCSLSRSSCSTLPAVPS